MNIFRVLLIGLLGLIALLTFWVGSTQSRLLGIEEDQLKINKERHIEYLYSTYQSNVNSCKELAKGKDEAFIQENCIKPLNSSIVGQWLREWDREDLLTK